jgi:hypothetical protein
MYIQSNRTNFLNKNLTTKDTKFNCSDASVQQENQLDPVETLMYLLTNRHNPVFLLTLMQILIRIISKLG